MLVRKAGSSVEGIWNEGTGSKERGERREKRGARREGRETLPISKIGVLVEFGVRCGDCIAENSRDDEDEKAGVETALRYCLCLVCVMWSRSGGT